MAADSPKLIVLTRSPPTVAGIHAETRLTGALICTIVMPGGTLEWSFFAAGGRLRGPPEAAGENQGRIGPVKSA